MMEFITNLIIFVGILIFITVFFSMVYLLFYCAGKEYKKLKFNNRKISLWKRNELRV